MGFLVASSQSDKEDLAFMKERAQLPMPTLENDEDIVDTIDPANLSVT